MSHVVCPSLCWVHRSSVQKQPTDRNAVWGLTCMGQINHALDRDWYPAQEEAILGCLRPLKSTGLTAYGKTDHTLLNNSMTAQLLRPTEILPIGCSYIQFSSVKNSPRLWYGVSSKFSDHWLSVRMHQRQWRVTSKPLWRHFAIGHARKQSQ